MRVLLAQRNARLLLTGEAFSIFGDRALFLALGIWVKTLTGSTSLAGLVFFAILVPSLAAPLFGYVVDRFDRRTVFVVVDLTTAAVVLSLWFVRGAGDVWLIFLVASLYGISSALLAACRSALMTEALPAEHLADANAFLQSTGEALRLLAPIVGAALFATLGGGAVASVDAATFVVSAVCAGRLQLTPVTFARRASTFLNELVAGVRHVWMTAALREIVQSLGLALLFVGAVEAIAFSVVSEGIDKPPSFLGVVMAAQGAGAVVGGLVAARLIGRVGDVGAMAAGLAAVALGVGGLAVPSTLIVLAAMVCAGIGVSWALVGYATAIQTRTPAALQGRVFAAAETLVTLPQTASIAVGSALVAVIDFPFLLCAAALVTAGIAANLARHRCAYVAAAPPARHRESLTRRPGKSEARTSACT